MEGLGFFLGLGGMTSGGADAAHIFLICRRGDRRICRHQVGYVRLAAEGPERLI
jgi:hypothetical protein